ncbi:uncharacterized protein PFLUO_LOCUS6552 [Penicillium psychrofluorescens]|uniref:uncharacterized protein n=1 Tax=Penicillium psychrofluorescens TaxID=3158075 RepID=UPI003CCD978F
MARGPGKARDYDYSNVGTAGRRTGLTLKEGRRDEHGMEEVDGLFSSPEKSPAKLNGFGTAADDDSFGSEMSMDEGNGPGPMDFLDANGSRNSYFPPPLARSPMKSGLTGSPRRTPGFRSSPDPQNEDMSSSPSEGRSLLSTRENTRLDPSPLSTRSANASNKKNIAKMNLKAPAIALDFSDDENEDQLNGDENGDFGNSFDIGNETMADDNELSDSPAPQNILDGASSLTELGSRPAEKAAPSSTGKRGAPSKTSSASKTEPKKRGRPRKAQQPADEEVADPRPTKKPKTTASTPQHAREPLEPELDKVVENYANRTGPLKGRSLYILKREIPTENNGTHTRSGRVSVRPLAYWRNERCVYGDGEAVEGQRYPLSTIKEVIRTEELEPEKQKKKGKRAGRKSKSRKSKDDSSDEEDENADVWEKEGGVLHGYVRKWDGDLQAGSTEEEVLDIAYAPSGIETRDVKGSTFRFAKLLSSTFIGSGVVELPPAGVKKPKNSKKMHMVFYVCHGRVDVDISGVQFSAGKGSVFQVPRGNYYSFQNSYDRETRLFFTQGCVPAEGEMSPEASASRDPGPESEVEPERAPPATKGRGRPKGKQKASK